MAAEAQDSQAVADREEAFVSVGGVLHSSRERKGLVPIFGR
jgi:hypothetical protein